MKKKSKKLLNDKGFTLVELIIVVAIIAMLIAMIAPNLTSFLDTASDTTLQANAKSSYTSTNAWVTRQRVAGVSLEDIGDSAPLVISLNDAGTALELTSSGSYTNMTTYSELLTLFNAGEFTENTELQIWFTSGYVVTKVTWNEGSANASYPD